MRHHFWLKLALYRQYCQFYFIWKSCKNLFHSMPSTPLPSYEILPALQTGCIHCTCSCTWLRWICVSYSNPLLKLNWGWPIVSMFGVKISIKAVDWMLQDTSFKRHKWPQLNLTGAKTWNKMEYTGKCAFLDLRGWSNIILVKLFQKMVPLHGFRFLE